jgi:hypothetical protein
MLFKTLDRVNSCSWLPSTALDTLRASTCVRGVRDSLTGFAAVNLSASVFSVNGIR